MVFWNLVRYGLYKMGPKTRYKHRITTLQGVKKACIPIDKSMYGGYRYIYIYLYIFIYCHLYLDGPHLVGIRTFIYLFIRGRDSSISCSSMVISRDHKTIIPTDRICPSSLTRHRTFPWQLKLYRKGLEMVPWMLGP